jgi:hypothetical protein
VCIRTHVTPLVVFDTETYNRCFSFPGRGLHSIEESILMSTWVHERNNTGKTIHILRDDFQTRFNKVTPPKMIML